MPVVVRGTEGDLGDDAYGLEGGGSRSVDGGVGVALRIDGGERDEDCEVRVARFDHASGTSVQREGHFFEDGVRGRAKGDAVPD